MALVLADRVQETTATTGTGALSLDGAETNFVAFSSVLADGDTTYYCVVDDNNNDWEVGLGTYTSATNTLARTTVLASSNSASVVNFGSGDKKVFITSPADLSSLAESSVQSGDNVSVLTNDVGYLTSFTETDPVFGASAASGITSTNITNWNTAYGWGDHATAGYLTGNQTITLSGDASGSGTTSITVTVANDSHTHDTRYYTESEIDSFLGDYLQLSGGTLTGNLNLASNLLPTTNNLRDIGSSSLYWNDIYVTNVNASTATFSGAVLASGGNSNNWNAAYGWGNHATAGYLTSVPSPLDHFRNPTGNYGSVEIDGGAVGGYEGYSIGGRVVFMHNNDTTSGIYNDVNNQWLFLATHGGASAMYHAGAQKIYTYVSGGRITGNLLATGDVFAYYSDERLKDIDGDIHNACEGILGIETFRYRHNDIAKEHGYEGDHLQVGVSAQSVLKHFPECVGRAPFDDDGEGGSVTGENYLTVKYDRLVAPLIATVQQQDKRLAELEAKLEALLCQRSS